MNNLSQEKSPYLLQHKDNPVNWYSWSERAFAAAKVQNKPIFLSIGYSTCYWCHVMEKDSFEKEEVARVLNESFISIKVDREERPDVDQIYMDAVMGLTGRGGWPMSVFLTPDLKPFWGGTFFYKDQFISILEQLASAWKENTTQVLQSAEKITQFLNRDATLREDVSIEKTVISDALTAYLQTYDSEYAGFGNAPKFPPAMQLSFLIRENLHLKKESLLSAILHTLDEMAKGGIYDQLSGGFHRYATDRKWLVPHFEKMLYDNALLSMTYLEAFQHTKRNEYLTIAEETLNYLLLDMTSPEGGFYAAEDAGEVDKEGEFYVWKESELREILSSDEFECLKKIYDISESGNFENNSIILAVKNTCDFSHKFESLFKSGKAKLLAQRSKRERPHRDEKIITAWCSMAISAFSKAYQVTSKDVYLQSAKKAANFVINNLYREKRLYRHYCHGPNSIEGFLEDYSFFISALLDLYQSDFDLNWYNLAVELQKIQDALFWDQQRGAYLVSSSREHVVDKVDLIDNALPSGNSTAFSNLLRLGEFSYDEEFLKKLDCLKNCFAPLITRYPSAFPKFLQGLQHYFADKTQLVIVCEDKKEALNFIAEVGKDFLPFHSNFVYSPDNDRNIPDILKDKTMLEDDKTTFYLCVNGSCKLPLCDFEEIRRELLQKH